MFRQQRTNVKLMCFFVLATNIIMLQINKNKRYVANYARGT